MDPVVEEIIESAKEGIEDRRQFYAEWWDERTEPIRSAWKVRPWWLRKKAWSRIGKDLLPDVPDAVQSVQRYREYHRLYEDLATLGELYPDIFNKIVGSPFGRFTVTVRLNVNERIPDIEPFMLPILEAGWEISSTSDYNYSRHYHLKHNDWLVEIAVWASILDAEHCEVVEHTTTKEVEETEYEIICEGERELTGREL